jgi:hypothetical protein
MALAAISASSNRFLFIFIIIFKIYKNKQKFMQNAEKVLFIKKKKELL